MLARSDRRAVPFVGPRVASPGATRTALRQASAAPYNRRQIALADEPLPIRPVQLTRDTAAAHVIRSYEPGRVRIGERWLNGHLIVAAEHLIENWHVAAPAAVTVADLEPALALQPEIVLLGTGAALVWPDDDIMSALAA